MAVVAQFIKGRQQDTIKSINRFIRVALSHQSTALLQQLFVSTLLEHFVSSSLLPRVLIFLQSILDIELETPAVLQARAIFHKDHVERVGLFDRLLGQTTVRKSVAARHSIADLLKNVTLAELRTRGVGQLVLKRNDVGLL